MNKLNFSPANFEKLQQQGWDKAALVTYINNINGNKLNANQEIFLVGSEIYTEMLKKSQLSDQEKVILVIDHLGGYLNDSGDLQFASTEYKFYDQMPPGAPFFDYYSKTVQRAYPNGLIIAQADKKLTKTALKKKYANETKIHQFRNQLDKCIIEYVEDYKKCYNLKNDEVAIKTILKDNWFYADPQYHNRAHIDIEISAGDLKKGSRTLTNKGLLKKIRKRGFYRKILSGDYHSEFILDEQGQLLSQWKEQIKERDYLECAIANGESFNYGERPRFDQYHTHDKLDGNPPRYFDTNKRTQLKQNWISPTDNWFYQAVRRLAEKGVRYKKRTNKI
ncbi:hypothetical protein UAW_02801 [Enterococcus haemoperoxidus ATCC BAA-382]|uniref:Uncharacterized protein n=1 Tax=Enterococcus haemoperoxidus ATCC BAA-382 TaxID=1158608 RepID=R2Q8D5_9ENTE|nr:DUF3114 domain-containing protein [Enterococcus haemoperoxidus]EOH92762.1 hypothetical protein UAW_02801 [Enterococcus haemoperoxidus ATCC BAA-382]EOT61505.1 hypothetical protein I583_00485 [Enterococcus haemoperoxidus ATCC BAA-382]OJG55338.1 hypothetical protein RV06_GL001781 [Enterococcus haemoperoxidus]